jgi:hypothetical protein
MSMEAEATKAKYRPLSTCFPNRDVNINDDGPDNP